MLRNAASVSLMPKVRMRAAAPRQPAVTDVDGLIEYCRARLEVFGFGPVDIPVIDIPPERTWVWSDLHFSDPGALKVFDRPFADVAAVNHHLLAEWQRLVRPDDTIICLGDVAHPDAWLDPRLMLDLRACPGHRLLVRGNHDTRRGGLLTGGFNRQCDFALYAADPPLALSHEPLEAVPVGAVNLHGHFHEGTEPTRRHINLAVERWEYSPVRMTHVVEVARRRLAGSQERAPLRAG